jgi:hypothetical protein
MRSDPAGQANGKSNGVVANLKTRITKLHNQDKDNGGVGDGLPDEGEVPSVCFPPTGSITKRLPLLAPCTPVGP